MANLIKDQALSFGLPRSIAVGPFPDILNLGRKPGEGSHYPGKESVEVGRLTVDVLFKNPAGGATVTVTVEASATENFAAPRLVGSNVFSLAEMRAGPCKVAISPNGLQYLRVNFTVATGFTGTAEAFLNTYMGK